MRREAARRLAALEARLLPPPRVYWSEWQRLLADDEYGLVWSLAERGACPGGEGDSTTWFDDWKAWRGLCQDAREIELLERIRRVAEANEGRSLHLHLLDLQL